MGKRGTKPLPNNVRAMNGYAGHNPKRNDLTPDPIVPEMPDWLTPKAKEIWAYLANELEKNALLTKRDQMTFAMLCNEAAKYIYASEMITEEGDEITITRVDESHQDRVTRHPALFVMNDSFKNYMKAAAEFGLSPSARVGLLGVATGNPTGIKGRKSGDAEKLFA